MIAAKGDIFLHEADAICITTNCMMKLDKDNRVVNVMGRGIAKQAADLYPKLPWHMAIELVNNGHHTQIIMSKELNYTPWDIVSFPTKVHWNVSVQCTFVTFPEPFSLR